MLKNLLYPLLLRSKFHLKRRPILKPSDTIPRKEENTDERQSPNTPTRSPKIMIKNYISKFRIKGSQ